MFQSTYPRGVRHKWKQGMNSKKLIKLLTDNGWKLSRVDGSHHIYTKPGNPNNLAVPHPRKDLKLDTVKGLLKKAGL